MNTLLYKRRHVCVPFIFSIRRFCVVAGNWGLSNITHKSILLLTASTTNAVSCRSGLMEADDDTERLYGGVINTEAICNSLTFTLMY